MDQPGGGAPQPEAPVAVFVSDDPRACAERPGLHPAQSRICVARPAAARGAHRRGHGRGPAGGLHPAQRQAHAHASLLRRARPRARFLFEPEIRGWLREQRLASLQTEFSRIAGGGYVQDALRRDASRLRDLLRRGAIVRVCGSRPMGRNVAQTLDGILGTLRLSVQQLKAKGRYAEDLF